MIRRIRFIGLIGLIGLMSLIGFIAAPSTAHALALRNTSNYLGLVGYWSFNDGAGTKAGDSSGQGNTGTLTNFALSGSTSNWVAGKKSKALNFDGTNDYLDNVGSASSFSFIKNTHIFSLSVWVYRSAGSAEQAIMGSTSTSAEKGFYFTIGDGTGKITLAVINGDGSTTNKVLQTGNVISAGSWYHIVATVDASSNAIIYVNGVSSATGTINTTDTGDSSRVLNIGRWNGPTPGGYHNGNLDDVRIYNRALTAGEVANMYNDGIAKINAPDKTGLVANWTFDEGSGTVAGDYSGRGNNGTLTNGPTYVAGQRGKALNFDGTNDYVAMSNSILALTNNFSISSWIKLGGSQTTKGIISDANGADAGYELALNSSGYFAFPRWNGGAVSTFIPSNGIWYHVVAVQDAGTAKIYIDGALNGSAGYSISANAGSLVIGRLYNDTSSFYFNGSIDDVRVYNRALSATEVANLYNSTKGGSTKISTVSRNGLVGYWSMDDGAGSQATDFSGKGNTGTLTNFALSGSTSNWITGKRGKGLNFDGTDDYVVISNFNNLLSGNNITASAWINPGGVGMTSDGAIVGSFNSGGIVRFTVSGNHEGCNNTSKVGAGFYDGSWHVACATISLTGWTHVVGTYDGSTIKIYVNGALANSASYSASLPASTGEWRIGRRWDTASYFNGSIDDVRVYNRALSAQEVGQLYNMGR